MSIGLIGRELQLIKLRSFRSVVGSLRQALLQGATAYFPQATIDLLRFRFPDLSDANIREIIGSVRQGLRAGSLLTAGQFQAGFIHTIAPIIPVLFDPNPFGRRFFYSANTKIFVAGRGEVWRTTGVESATQLTLDDARQAAEQQVIEEGEAKESPPQLPPGVESIFFDFAVDYIIRRY